MQEPGNNAKQILWHRLDMLYSGALLSMALAMAVAVALYVVHFSHTGPAHPAWLAGTACLLGALGVLHMRYRKVDRMQGNPAEWLLYYRTGAVFNGALWGLGGMLFLGLHQDALQLFTILCVVGISAGALGPMTADYASYRNFVLLAMLPTVAAFIAQQNTLGLPIGLLTFLLILLLLKSGRRAHDAMLESTTLLFEKAGLLDELEREKRHLVNEAETIMRKVLSSAPITLWAIDHDGRVTFLDGERLGRQGGDQRPVGKHKGIEIFLEQPQLRAATRQALDGANVIEEIELDDKTYEVHYGPLHNEHDSIEGAIGVAIDISERKRHEAELIQEANYDGLTGLPNRTLILSRLEEAFARAQRAKHQVAVFFLDLDNFKAVNDTMGHEAGDELLRQTARRLRDTLRGTDLPARLSGDEFLILAGNLQKVEYAEAIGHKIVNAFRSPFLLDEREIFMTTSVGIAIYPQDGATTGELLRSADTAMYHAKAQGKNTYGFFTAQMQEAAQRHLLIETELRRAMERDELQLHYQAKVNPANGLVVGAEALLRWENAALGSVSPVDFIPVAEFAGLMPGIGDWVLRTACSEAVRWQALVPQPVKVAINVSPQQFRNTDLLANVIQAMVDSGLTTDLIELEITESVLVQDGPETLNVLNDLRELNITLALDDFGTGYSSLSYLKRFPLQVLKIDRSFIKDLDHDGNEDSLVDAIIAMGHSLGMDIVAEGVETAAQLAYLSARKVNCVQGYYFSKPLPAGEFSALLAERNGPARTAAIHSIQLGSPSRKLG